MAQQQEEEKKQSSPIDTATDAVRMGMKTRGKGAAAKVGTQLAARAAAALAPTVAAALPILLIIIGIIVVVLILVVFIVIILVAIGVIGGGGSAFGSTGDGLGVKPNYCQDSGLMDYNGDGVADECSQELESLIVEAASWAKVPAAVLNGSALIEGLDFSLTDQQVIVQRLSGAQSTPCDGQPGPDGPMQFSLSTWTGNNYQYGNASIEAEARPVGYATDRCNLLDSLYAAAKLLKLSTGKSLDDTSRWTEEDIKNAGAGYYTNGQSCTWDTDGDGDILFISIDGDGNPISPPIPEFNYCEELLARYDDKKDVTVGDTSSPAGRCPIEGQISSSFGPSHPLGVDITSGSDGATVLSPISGQVSVVRDMGSDSYGLYVVIRNDQYEVLLAHFNRDLPILVSEGEQVAAGQPLGTEGNTGFSSGVHVHYEIHSPDGSRLNPEEFIPIGPSPPGSRWPFSCIEGGG